MAGTMLDPPASRIPAVALAITTLLSKAIRDRAFLASLVGGLVALLAILVGALWPSLHDTFRDLSDSFPHALTTMLRGADMSTPSGWGNAEVLSFMAPGGAAAVGLISAVRATAGEEEAQTLGLVLSAPVSRTTFLLAKAAAMVVHVVIVGALVSVGFMLGNLIGDMGLPMSGMIAAGLHTSLFGVLFGFVGLLLGGSTGHRRLSLAVGAGLVGLSFAGASFLPLSDSLAGWARISPWYYYNSSDPLANGPDWTHLLVLAILAVIVALVAVVPFQRRDLHS